jgi:hypothetical protein
MESFTLKEIVMKQGEKLDMMDVKLNTLLNLNDEVKENTAFRNKVMHAIVGTAFLALVGLGLAVLKAVNILKL